MMSFEFRLNNIQILKKTKTKTTELFIRMKCCCFSVRVHLHTNADVQQWWMRMREKVQRKGVNEDHDERGFRVSPTQFYLLT
jgi:hypothetical protein